MFHLIGLGLNDEKDLSLKAIETLKHTDKIFAEFHTSSYSGNIEEIEEIIENKITILERSDVEEKSEEVLLKQAKEKDIALLVPGDPMIATTHASLILSAKRLGIETKVIHSSSVYSAIAETGLQIYKFGKTTTIPYLEENYLPVSPYHVLEENLSIGLHTLFLLEIEMTIGQAISILLEMEKKQQKNLFNENTLCVGTARLGGDSIIKCGEAKKLAKHDFGKPPHCLIVPGKLHFMEEEFLEMFEL